MKLHILGCGDAFASGAHDKELPPTAFQILHPDQPSDVAGIEVFPFRVPHQTHEISLGLKVGYEGKQILYSGDSS